MPAVLAVGRIDLVTKAELTIHPLRALLIVAAAVIFESLFACAVAFLIVYVLSVPFLYRVKAKCIPTDYKTLVTGLFSSLKLTAFTLAAPAVLLILIPEPQDLPEVAAVLAAAATLAGISWIAALFLLNHP